MIETTVSQRRELTSERFLKESEDQRAEREVFRHGFVANSVTDDITGQCRSQSVYSIRGLGNPSALLSDDVRRKVPERSVRRALQLVCPPP